MEYHLAELIKSVFSIQNNNANERYKCDSGSGPHTRKAMLGTEYWKKKDLLVAIQHLPCLLPICIHYILSMNTVFYILNHHAGRKASSGEERELQIASVDKPFYCLNFSSQIVISLQIAFLYTISDYKCSTILFSIWFSDQIKM